VRQRKRPSAFIPFKYQGQYADKETGLYYNRFRYYDPRTGAYISQDPIGLAGNNPTLYGYVKDANDMLDILGLDVYKLVASSDGWYPVYEKGKKDPIAYTRLDKGDVYKIGESQKSSNRYSSTRMDEVRINKSKATSVMIGPDGKAIQGQTAGLNMKYIDTGEAKSADRPLETMKLKEYHKEHGKLPAGNKTFH